MNKILLFFLWIIGMTSALQGQDGFIYHFDECQLAEGSNRLDAATSTSLPDCDCGLEGDALLFDGNLDNVVFPDTIKDILSEDFTLSFYFRLNARPILSDIFSIRNACNFDSLFSIKHDPANNELITELANNVSTLKTIITPLDENRCWNRYVLTKNDLLYSIYLNGELVESHLAFGQIVFGKEARAGFGVSPCLLSSEVRFGGWIDEFQIIPRALTKAEIQANDLYADQIITRDTTIIAGNTVEINTGRTCSDNFAWTPEETLDDADILDPVASPEETTTYALEIVNNGTCLTTDSITIYVVKSEDLDCEKLLLPSAFTPNNDNLNDEYGISNLYIVDELESFEIYDRWGNKMWEGNEKTSKWDGYYKGNAVNPGVYIYKIRYTCSGEEQFVVNNFTVIR